jgi:hypothetical protein
LPCTLENRHYGQALRREGMTTLKTTAVVLVKGAPAFMSPWPI